MRTKRPLHFVEKFYIEVQSRIECWDLIAKSKKIDIKYAKNFDYQTLAEKISNDASVISQIKEHRHKKSLKKSQRSGNFKTRSQQIYDEFKKNLEKARQKRNAAIDAARKNFEIDQAKLIEIKEKSLGKLDAEKGSGDPDGKIKKLYETQVENYESILAQ